MKKNLFIIFILLFLFFIIIINNSLVIKSCIDSINIFKNNLFPVLFPFFILSDLLINYKFADIISIIFKNIFKKLFKTDKICSYVFIIGCISGYSNAFKTIKELYDQNKISEQMINKIILFCHFVNPLYIVSTLSIYLCSFKLSIIILIIHYFSNIIVGLIFRNYNESKNNDNFVLNKDKSDNFFISISNSIKKSINTLLIILGSITIITILSNLICANINNIFIKTIIEGIFDFVNGINSLNYLNLSIKIKALFCIIFISFGGISTHLQVFSILSDVKINYFYYLLSRILHSLISFILLFIVLQIL